MDNNRIKIFLTVDKENSEASLNDYFKFCCDDSYDIMSHQGLNSNSRNSHSLIDESQNLTGLSGVILESKEEHSSHLIQSNQITNDSIKDIFSSSNDFESSPNENMSQQDFNMNSGLPDANLFDENNSNQNLTEPDFDVLMKSIDELLHYLIKPGQNNTTEITNQNIPSVLTVGTKTVNDESTSLVQKENVLLANEMEIDLDKALLGQSKVEQASLNDKPIEISSPKLIELTKDQKKLKETRKNDINKKTSARFGTSYVEYLDKKYKEKRNANTLKVWRIRLRNWYRNSETKQKMNPNTMVVQCSFCHSWLAENGLNRHKTTNIYCLDKQKKVCSKETNRYNRYTVESLLGKCGLWSPSEIINSIAINSNQINCVCCNKTFDSEKAMRTHSTRKHGVKKQKIF